MADDTRQGGDVNALDRHIGARLRQARVSAALSGFNVAEGLRMRSAELVAIENGEKRAMPGVLLALCEMYGVPIQFVFSGFEDENEPSPDSGMLH